DAGRTRGLPAVRRGRARGASRWALGRLPLRRRPAAAGDVEPRRARRRPPPAPAPARVSLPRRVPGSGRLGAVRFATALSLLSLLSLLALAAASSGCVLQASLDGRACDEAHPCQPDWHCS